MALKLSHFCLRDVKIGWVSYFCIFIVPLLVFVVLSMGLMMGRAVGLEIWFCG